MMKRIIAMILATVLLLLLCACGAVNPPAPQQTEPPETEPTGTVAETDPTTVETSASTNPPQLSKEEQERAALKNLIEATDRNVTQIPVSIGSDDITVTECKHLSGRRFPTGGRLYPEPVRITDHFFEVSDGLVMFDEMDIYPESEGKYLYVFFEVYAATHGTEFLRLTSATVADDTLKLHFDVEDIDRLNYPTDEAIMNDMLILKIEKDSFDEMPIKIEFSFTNHWTPSTPD